MKSWPSVDRKRKKRDREIEGDWERGEEGGSRGRKGREEGRRKKEGREEGGWEERRREEGEDLTTAPWSDLCFSQGR